MQLRVLGPLKASAIAGSMAGVVSAAFLVVAGAVAAPFASAGVRPFGDAVQLALFVAFFGTLIGTLLGIVVGFPVLVLLSYVRLNRPLVAAPLGALLGVVTAYLLGFPQTLGWYVLVALAAVGAFCGAVASYVCALTPPSSGQPTAAAHVER